jgi:hypothetical protein
MRVRLERGVKKVRDVNADISIRKDKGRASVEIRKVNGGGLSKLLNC